MQAASVMFPHRGVDKAARSWPAVKPIRKPMPTGPSGEWVVETDGKEDADVLSGFLPNPLPASDPRRAHARQPQYHRGHGGALCMTSWARMDYMNRDPPLQNATHRTPDQHEPAFGNRGRAQGDACD